jgi:serine/threonine protein phosphatase 1
MFSKLFKRRPAPSENIQGIAPPGKRIYAIGDIHGRLDLFRVLLRTIENDNAARAPADTQLILLGDLIDRGPDSAGVVQAALELRHKQPNARFLLGNHEEVFLSALAGDLKTLAFFLRIGGRETILSYGVSEKELHESDYAGLHALLNQRVPAEHVRFLQSFEDMISEGEYVFVHAGVRPSVDMALQKPSDLRWIREEFLSHTGSFDKVVVHGHTIFPGVEYGASRIGLDTGAYRTGVLTAMGFEGTERWTLEARDSPL